MFGAIKTKLRLSNILCTDQYAKGIMQTGHSSSQQQVSDQDSTDEKKAAAPAPQFQALIATSDLLTNRPPQYAKLYKLEGLDMKSDHQFKFRRANGPNMLVQEWAGEPERKVKIKLDTDKRDPTFSMDKLPAAMASSLKQKKSSQFNLETVKEFGYQCVAVKDKLPATTHETWRPELVANPDWARKNFDKGDKPAFRVPQDPRTVLPSPRFAQALDELRTLKDMTSKANNGPISSNSSSTSSSTHRFPRLRRDQADRPAKPALNGHESDSDFCMSDADDVEGPPRRSARRAQPAKSKGQNIGDHRAVSKRSHARGCSRN